MIPDPFLDPPRQRRGCWSMFTAAAIVVFVAVFAVARWGIGDAFAAVMWLAFFGTIAAVARIDARRHDRRHDRRLIDPSRHPSAGRTHLHLLDPEDHPR